MYFTQSRIPFYQKHPVGKVCARLVQGKRMYDLDKDFLFNFAITLNLDVETWFKITAKSLRKEGRGLYFMFFKKSYYFILL